MNERKLLLMYLSLTLLVFIPATGVFNEIPWLNVAWIFFTLLGFVAITAWAHFSGTALLDKED